VRLCQAFANEPSPVDGLSSCADRETFIGANKNSAIGLQIFGAIISEYTSI
jgi:hypothetical protein